MSTGLESKTPGLHAKQRYLIPGFILLGYQGRISLSLQLCTRALWGAGPGGHRTRGFYWGILIVNLQIVLINRYGRSRCVFYLRPALGKHDADLHSRPFRDVFQVSLFIDDTFDTMGCWRRNFARSIRALLNDSRGYLVVGITNFRPQMNCLEICTR